MPSSDTAGRHPLEQAAGVSPLSAHVSAVPGGFTPMAISGAFVRKLTGSVTLTCARAAAGRASSRKTAAMTRRTAGNLLARDLGVLTLSDSQGDRPADQARLGHRDGDHRAHLQP